MTQNPVEAFLDWYRAAPPEVRGHMAFMCGGQAPGDTLAGDYAIEPLVSDAFCERITNLAGDSPFRIIGTAIMLRGLVDFNFMGRETTKDWENAREMNLMVAARAKQEGGAGASLSEKLLDTIDQIELRSRQWIRESERWEQVKKDALSDERLDQWLKQNLVSRD